MSESMRAFLGITPPAAVREQVAAAVDEARAKLGQGVRWTQVENLHLTLKFLGEIDPEQIPRLLQRAHAKLANTAAFDASLAGLGAFPNPREAKVLWLGVARGLSPMAKLARKLDAAASAVGVERDRRPFRAHLTLGRLREPARLEIERLKAPPEVPFRVEEVILYESRLSPDGARHIPLAHLPIGSADGADDYDRAMDSPQEV